MWLSPVRFALRRWPLVAAIVSLCMLLAAHLFERAGYAPCDLCLRQREVYWVALAVALLGIALTVSRPVIGRWPAKLSIAALGLIFAGGAVLAAYHAGVEWDFWPGPACGVRGTDGPVTLESMDAALSGRTRLVLCDEAAWRFLGVSMAGYNALVSAVLALMSVLALRRREPSLG